MGSRLFTFALATVLTLLNAAKPVVVDDTAYLEFARHLSQHPDKPYDFKLFWYYEPQPAMEILMPPVLPCWLGLGIAIFGEHLFLLKLWLFPFSFLICYSVRSLMRRFAPTQEFIGTTFIVISPFVLCLYNFMLDVPAVALGLTAVACFIRACDEKKVGWAVVAGLCAGLAAQTKYTQLIVPGVLFLYPFAKRQRNTLLYWLLSLLIAIVVFVSWEIYVKQQCGKSHFQEQLKENASTLAQKLKLVQDTILYNLSQLGGLLLGLIPLLLVPLGLPRWTAIPASLLLAAGLIIALILPMESSICFHLNVAPGAIPWPMVLFLSCVGIALLLGYVATMRVVITRPCAEFWFLILWVLVEFTGTMAMAPFPAARRMMGIAIAGAVLTLFTIDRLNIRLPRWVYCVGIGWGLTLFAVDAWDAHAERKAVEWAARTVQPEQGETVWYTGHWGFQYYADRAGMKQLVAYNYTDVDGIKHLMALKWHPKPGDYLIFPDLPDLEGFYRPYPMMSQLPDWLEVERIDSYAANDRLMCQTVPNLYGGYSVILGRDHPRIRIIVYRVIRDNR